MAILISFIPWFLFWIFLSLHMLEVAAFAGLLCSLFVILLGIIKKRNIKILQLGTFAFFLCFSISVIFANKYWLGHWINLLGSTTLMFIALFSILFRKPFTLQYARDNAPKERWKSKQFIHSNYVITWVWFIAFSINTSFSAITITSLKAQTWIHWIVAITCFSTAAIFTHLYRKRIKKESIFS